MPYRAKRYENIFDIDRISLDDHLEALRDKDILKYWTKFIKSGEMLEVIVYPLWKTGKAGIEAAIPKLSREAQKELNHKNRVRRVVRLMNTNFTDKDIWITLTYDPAHLPSDEKEAQKAIQNYIRRLRAFIKKNGLPDLKYIYVTETMKEDGEVGRVHHHIIMNFHDRDMAESIWNKGGRNQARRLVPDDFGLEGLARYISKGKNDTADRKYSKKYGYSLNLDKPIEEKRENVIRKRKAEKIALDPSSAKDVFEDLARKAPKNIKGDYIFLDMKPMYSRYVSGVYLYVRMREAPKNKKKGRSGLLTRK